MDQQPLTITDFIKRLKEVEKQFGNLELRLWYSSSNKKKKDIIYPVCIITTAPGEHKKIALIL